jgi:hypothetical protein
MTEAQRQLALTFCDRILETAAKLQADLQQAADVIEEEIEANLMPRRSGSCETAVRHDG